MNNQDLVEQKAAQRRATPRRTASPTAGLWRGINFPSANFAGEGPVQLEGRIAGFTDSKRHPAIVLHHPNPHGGGSMDSKILRAIADALYPLGVGFLRYNSRGVGKSGGRTVYVPEAQGWVEGSREAEDVGAALSFLAAQPWVDPDRMALAGFSFGSRMVLSYLHKHPDDSRVKAAVCVGMPVAAWDLSHLGQWPGPKLFVSGDQDEYGPAPALTSFVNGLPDPAVRVQLKGTTHFLPDREWEAGAIAARFLTPILGLPASPQAP